MQRVNIDAFAKINWSLGVTGRREDGYHLLDMLLQSISLHDSLSICHGEGLSLIVNNKPAVRPENNLCYKAANAFYNHTGMPPACEITLTKRIPVCAGMGGGSADAAAVLMALNILHQTKLTSFALSGLALSLGADVPFMLRGGLMRAQGIGEKLTPQRLGRTMHLVVVMPRRGAVTREIFAEFDALPPQPPVDNRALAAALSAGDPASVAKLLGNHLQAVTAAQNPDIQVVLEAIKNAGALGTVMTGSGSACYGLFASRAEAYAAYSDLRAKLRCRVYCAYTVSSAQRLLTVR